MHCHRLTPVKFERAPLLVCQRPSLCDSAAHENLRSWPNVHNIPTRDAFADDTPSNDFAPSLHDHLRVARVVHPSHRQNPIFWADEMFCDTPCSTANAQSARSCAK